MIEGVIVCVNYGDFLAETLPLNKQHFDKLVVVTSEEDLETQKLCEYHYVECVIADFGPPGTFDKARGINEGLKHLSKKSWVIHLDADIALTPQTGQILRSLKLDTNCLYGIDRFLIKSYKLWRRQVKKPQVVNEMNTYIHTQKFTVGTRFMADSYGGYIPIGFFQMWNPMVSGVYEYPEGHTSAGRTDMLFAGEWPRSRRHMLPEIVAFHLESEPAPQGINWSGRKTRPFRKPTCRERLPWRHHKKPCLPQLPPPTYEV